MDRHGRLSSGRRLDFRAGRAQRRGLVRRRAGLRPQHGREAAETGATIAGVELAASYRLIGKAGGATSAPPVLERKAADAYGRAAAISKTTPQTSAAPPRIGGNGMVFFVSLVAVMGPTSSTFSRVV